MITTEQGDLKIYKFSPEEAAQLRKQTHTVHSNIVKDFDMMANDNEEEGRENDVLQSKKKHKNAKAFKPFWKLN